MATLFSRKAAAVTFGVLALTLAGGGIAAAQPSTKAPAEVNQPVFRAAAPAAQPPVSAAEARAAKAALTKESLRAAALPGTAQTSFAVVRTNGTLARGFGAVSSAKLGTGQYQVVFDHVVSDGAFVATIGRYDDCCIPTGGYISVAPRLGTPNAVFVQTRNYAGTPTDLYFHLAVHD